MFSRIAYIALAQFASAEVAGKVAELLDADSGSLQERLALAVHAEQELTDAAHAIEANLHTARAAATTRVVRLRAEIRDAALTEVAEMLRAGVVTMGEIAARAGVAVDANPTLGNTPADAPQSAAPLNPVVTADSTPTPTPVMGPAPVLPTTTATSQGAADAVSKTVPANVRENLRVQGAYLNAVKFRDPNTGAGWSGRGPTPKWLKALCTEGKTIEDFRVVANGGAPAPAAAETPPASPAAAETPAATTVPAAAETPAADAGQAAATDTRATADIGEEVVSFDASGLDGDLNTAPDGGASDDDFGEFVVGIGAMGLGQQFLVAA